MSKKARNKRAAQRDARATRSSQVWLVALVAAVALGAVAVIALSSMREDAAAPAEAGASRYEGIARGETAGGLPRLGDANAPVLVHDISDFT